MMQIIVIGGGSIGKRHIKNLLELDMAIQLTVVDPCETLCEEIKNDFAVDTYFKLEEAIQKKKYDVAFICSPNHLHVSQALTLAKESIHVFIEKPVSLSLEEAKGLIPVVEEHKIDVMVGCNLRFHPGVVCLLGALESELIGRPLYARAHFAHYLPNWRPGQDYRKTYSANKDQGGGILLDDIHEPDYLCWLLGGVVKVSGSLENLGDLNIDSEDIAEYTLWHRCGAYSQIHTDYLRRDKSRGCELVGTAGTLVWKSTGKNPEVVTVEWYSAETEKWSVLLSLDAYDQNQQYVDEVKYFLDNIQRGKKPMNGLDEALALISVLDTVKKASHLGQIDVASLIN
jgi:predicted dehydrogenase